MNPDRIVIRSDELRTAKVDAQLAQQQGFGMPAHAQEQRARWYYQTWFVLMLAGGVAGFIVWAAFEPVYDDHCEVYGNAELAPEIDYGPELLALRLSGATVVAPRKFCTVTKAGEPITWEALASDLERAPLQVARVRGEVIEAEPRKWMLVAIDIDLSLDYTTKYKRADLAGYYMRDWVLGIALFPLLAGFVGLFIGAADGLICRAYGRAFTCGIVGLGIGLVAGLAAAFLAGKVYEVGSAIVEGLDTSKGAGLSTAAFLVQMMQRGVAWAVAGTSMGLGQGVALKSRRLLINGLLGGTVGALIGGMLFDPINYLAKGGAQNADDAWQSRLVGFTAIGLAVGAMIGLVELMARDAWLKMLAGPLAGKEFVIFHNPTRIGSSPKAEIYLFKDARVEPIHAQIHWRGEGLEIEDLNSGTGTFVNGKIATRTRLGPANQDQIQIGTTVFGVSIRDR